jgi:hypothetical protein
MSREFCETGDAQGVSANWDGRSLGTDRRQWELVEPILQPGRREDNRDRSWQDTRSV